MSDRAARLEELQKITGDESIEALEKRTWLDLFNKNLTSVPLGVCDLTGLVQLWLCANQLSSLPPEISHLTQLTLLNVRDNRLSSLPPEISHLTELMELYVQSNPIEELPSQITELANLKTLLIIDRDGKVNIKCAPRGITTLPCWNDTIKWEGQITNGQAFRKLELFGPELPSDPDSAPVTGKYADVMTVKFTPKEMLGEGGFGTAYKVQLNKDIVAVKVLKKKAQPGTAEYDELTKEAKIMKDLHHENIIGLYAYGCRSQEVFYVMEYADGKSIWDIIEASGALPLDTSIQYSIHINAGLKYLHSQSPPVEHRDLKPENVLICNGVAKICDFGISSARETISRTTGFKGTFHYASPEYFDTEKSYGPMSDIYTFALVVWAMVEGKRPYDGLNHGQITAQKLQQKLPEMSPSTPAKLVALMNECWNTEARKRPSAADLEPRLADILKTPGPAVGEKGTSVKDMNTAELVAYLEGKKVLKQFVDVIEEHNMMGKDFIQFEEEDLISAPFELKAIQAKIIVKFVEAAKLT